jgi:peroxiredoxin
VILPNDEEKMENVRPLKNSALLQKIAPGFTLPNANGEPVNLSQLLNEGHRALVVFLRHLG